MPVAQTTYGSALTAAPALLDEPAWEAAWAEGRAMSLEQAIAYALEAEVADGQPARGQHRE